MVAFKLEFIIMKILIQNNLMKKCRIFFFEIVEIFEIVVCDLLVCLNSH